MRATILPYRLSYLNKVGRGQYDGQAVYCGLSTASEMFFIFNTQLYSFLCNYDAIVSYFDKREVLQQEYSQPQIFPSPHIRWVGNCSDMSPELGGESKPVEGGFYYILGPCGTDP